MSAGVALLVFILAFVIFSMVLKVPVSFGLAIASLFVYLGTNMNPITVAQYSFASLDRSGNRTQVHTSRAHSSTDRFLGMKRKRNDHSLGNKEVTTQRVSGTRIRLCTGWL